jgi:hypothetical protein
MEDALKEADEIYRSVHEGFTSHDQEILMDLFSKDDQASSHFDRNNGIEPKEKDRQKRDDTQLTELDAEIDNLGMVFKLTVRFS